MVTEDWVSCSCFRSGAHQLMMTHFLSDRVVGVHKRNHDFSNRTVNYTFASYEVLAAYSKVV